MHSLKVGYVLTNPFCLGVVGCEAVSLARMQAKKTRLRRTGQSLRGFSNDGANPSWKHRPAAPDSLSFHKSWHDFKAFSYERTAIHSPQAAQLDMAPTLRAPVRKSRCWKSEK